MTQPPLICFSHLRWDFVYQRPQHLLSRAAQERDVFYVEEPVHTDGEARMVDVRRPGGVRLLVPHVPHGLSREEAEEVQRRLLDEVLGSEEIGSFIAWYYTPMALGFSAHLEPLITIYDVMDELSLFRGAPPELLEREAELYRRADIVFAGGASLYAAKSRRHPDVHLFPSSIDAEHFGQARLPLQEPEDQSSLPSPILGFFGVIDERMDIDLLAELAGLRPEWQIVMVGPVVKIDPAELPQRPNIHYLGARPYDDLPRYIARWDVALMPWVQNESTRFISPTKTPEYLAAGTPVVSTAIDDVVRPYGEEGLVRIAETAREFVTAVEQELAMPPSERAEWLERVDARLAGTSWDLTWEGMSSHLTRILRKRSSSADRPRAAAGAPT